MDIKTIAYEKYKLNWMMAHGCTLSDVMNELDDMQEDEPDTCVSNLFSDWEYEFGFASEIWASYGEFLECEFQDKDYMKSILNEEEYKEYLEEE